MTKTAFLFPGQGAQSVGMGRELVDANPIAREMLDRASGILGYDLADICFNGPDERLDSTIYSQPALYVMSLIELDDIRKRRPGLIDEVELTAGLSLGEYTALAFADAVSFEDALRLVQRRGEAMQAAADAESSGMASVLGMDASQVEEICDMARHKDEVLRIANFLCPGNLVISGHRASCDRAAVMAEQQGAMKVIPLAVAGAFHTSLMEPALEQLREAIANTEFRTPRIPVVSNVDAKPHTSTDEIRELLLQQVSSPVLWENSMRYMLAEGIEQFYEIGPGRVLRGLMKRIDRKVPCHGATEIVTA